MDQNWSQPLTLKQTLPIREQAEGVLLLFQDAGKCLNRRVLLLILLFLLCLLPWLNSAYMTGLSSAS
jgi:hypothetical protein